MLEFFKSIFKDIDSISRVFSIFGYLSAFLTLIILYFTIFRIKLYLTSRATFYIEKNLQNPEIIYLKKIICPITIVNRSRQFGVVYHILLRVYSDNELSPNSVTYLANYYFNNLPMTKVNYDEDEKNKEEFYAIGINPKSSLSKTICCGDDHNSSNLIINPSGNYIVELFYKKRKGNKWKLASKYFLLNHFPFEERTLNDKDCIWFNLVDYSGKDSYMASNLPTEKTNIYKGVTDDLLSSVKFRFRRIIRILMKILWNVSIWIPRHLYFFINYIFQTLIKRFIIRFTLNLNKRDYDYPKNMLRDKSFEKLKKILIKQISYFNQHSNVNLEIVKENEREIDIQKDNKILHIYKTGSGSIFANTPKQELIFLEYNIEIKNSPLSYLYNIPLYSKKYSIRRYYFGILRFIDRLLILPKWGFVKGKRTSIRSYAIKVLDGFILHSKN